MLKAKGNLWDIIAEGEFNYRLRELETHLEKARYNDVLRYARSRAETLKQSVTIDAFYDGQWLQMDVAYPNCYSK